MSNAVIEVNSAIDQIISSNERIQKFWTEEATNWTPEEAAKLLENSRMDRLVSLSHSLRFWTQPCAPEDQEGRLILAWANLGILVEGAMTWFLCVFENDYAEQPMKKRNGSDLQPNRLHFEEMCRFFCQNVWTDVQVPKWDAWLTTVRNRRNAVHAFNHREIGTLEDWCNSVVRFHDFIVELDSRAPYPDSRDIRTR